MPKNELFVNKYLCKKQLNFCIYALNISVFCVFMQYLRHFLKNEKHENAII